jgi:hypothetical protein
MRDLFRRHIPQPPVQIQPLLRLPINVHAVQRHATVVGVLGTAHVFGGFAGVGPLGMRQGAVALIEQQASVASEGEDVGGADGTGAQKLVCGGGEERGLGRSGEGDEDGGQGCSEGDRGGEEGQVGRVQQVGQQREGCVDARGAVFLGEGTDLQRYLHEGARDQARENDAAEGAIDEALEVALARAWRDMFVRIRG